MADNLLAIALDLAAMRWQADALCVEHPDVEFFPSAKARPDAARAVCARCLVSEECLEYALGRGIEHGVWGGTSPKERREICKHRAVVGAGDLPRAA